MVWIAVGACLLCAFVFSGIEAGILSVNRVRLRHRVKMKDRAAIKLRALLVNPERFLVTVLVVTNLMSITAIALATQELVGWFGVRGYGWALAIFLPVHLFVVEALPKSLFRRFPYRALAFLAEPLRVADFLLWPMHFIGWRLSRLFLRDRADERTKLFIAREDFKYFTVEGERVGALSQAERQMIHNVIDFRAMTARGVMIPIPQAHTIRGTALVSELMAKSLETNVERWPVINEAGEFTGVVDVYDLVLDAKRNERVEVYQRRLVRVAPNEPAYAALRKLRAARVSLGLVAEPNAPPVGLVTTADLVRRLVDTASSKPAGTGENTAGAPAATGAESAKGATPWGP
jgi:putative hemolysin